jgi:hypothetical protein
MAKITVGWAKNSDLAKFAKADSSAGHGNDIWGTVDFEVFLAQPYRQLLGMYAGRHVLAYACMFIRGRMWLVERLVAVNSAEEDYDIFLLQKLMEYVDENDKTQLEIHIEETDDATVGVLKLLGFKAVPWPSGRYVNKLCRYRLRYWNVAE